MGTATLPSIAGCISNLRSLVTFAIGRLGNYTVKRETAGMRRNRISVFPLPSYFSILASYELVASLARAFRRVTSRTIKRRAVPLKRLSFLNRLIIRLVVSKVRPAMSAKS